MKSNFNQETSAAGTRLQQNCGECLTIELESGLQGIVVVSRVFSRVGRGAKDAFKVIGVLKKRRRVTSRCGYDPSIYQDTLNAFHKHLQQCVMDGKCQQSEISNGIAVTGKRFRKNSVYQACLIQHRYNHYCVYCLASLNPSTVECTTTMECQTKALAFQILQHAHENQDRSLPFFKAYRRVQSE
jgi:hypothetical protein